MSRHEMEISSARERMRMRLARPWLVERLDDLHDREFAVAADLGCNAGHVLKHLGLHGSVGRIINLDMSPMMLERARAAGVADHGTEVEEEFVLKVTPEQLADGSWSSSCTAT